MFSIDTSKYNHTHRGNIRRGKVQLPLKEQPDERSIASIEATTENLVVKGTITRRV